MTLGEAPIWHNQRQSWLWLDIINKQLFELPHHDREQQPSVHRFSLMPSIIVEQPNGCVLVIAQYQMIELDLESGLQTLLCTLPVPEGFRTNDGGVCDNGLLWFSTMHKTSPLKFPGSIYVIDQRLNIKCQLLNQIHIANTFCWVTVNRVLISDSLLQLMYDVPYHNGVLEWHNKIVFDDLSSTNAAHDGGAIDVFGQIWNAQWAAGRVRCYQASGAVVTDVSLPVLQPSSCCFGGPENKHLLITSATEGMNARQIKQFPLSGSIFLLELDVEGRSIPIFEMD